MLDELCNVTAALLEESMGTDKLADFLNITDAELTAKFVTKPHAEVAGPIPEGIHPAFPDEAQNVLRGAKIDVSTAALMGAFAMPVAEG